MKPKTIERAMRAAESLLPDGYYVIILSGPILLEDTPPPYIATVCSSVGDALTRKVIIGMGKTLEGEGGGGELTGGDPDS